MARGSNGMRLVFGIAKAIDNSITEAKKQKLRAAKENLKKLQLEYKDAEAQLRRHRAEQEKLEKLRQKEVIAESKRQAKEKEKILAAQAKERLQADKNAKLRQQRDAKARLQADKDAKLRQQKDTQARLQADKKTKLQQQQLVREQSRQVKDELQRELTQAKACFQQRCDARKELRRSYVSRVIK